MTRHLNTWEQVSEKVYDVILTPFLVQNFWKFARGVSLEGSMTVRNLDVFAWREAKLRDPPPPGLSVYLKL